MPPEPAIHPDDFLQWRPLPDTAIQLGRLRAHAHAQDASSGVWYDMHLVLAMADRDGQPHAAPSLHLTPRLRRAFDLPAIQGALQRWNGRAPLESLDPLLPGADADGFASPTVETDPDRRWDNDLSDSILPLELLHEDEATRQGALRRALGRSPWALLDPCNHLASVYPLLEDMDPVDAACSGLMAAAAGAWSPDAQEHRGRSICISPPPIELDLLLQLAGPRRSEAEKARLELFVSATCTPLITGRRPIAARLLHPQAKQWRDHARRWCVREPDERGLSADERPSLPPFSPCLVPDETQARPVSGSHPRVSALPFQRRWLCSGRAARFLWVCAAGEPDANLRLTLTAEGTWPSFLQRREAQFLDAQVEQPDGAHRWATGFDSDVDSLLARLAPECRAVPRSSL
jgi:hypothetical protein